MRFILIEKMGRPSFDISLLSLVCLPLPIAIIARFNSMILYNSIVQFHFSFSQALEKDLSFLIFCECIIIVK